jgi:hypothetical protein
MIVNSRNAAVGGGPANVIFRPTVASVFMLRSNG